jgi:hypothetical protein
MQQTSDKATSLYTQVGKMAEAQSKSDETRLHIATKQADTQLKIAIVVSLAFLARDLVPQLLSGLGRMFRGELGGVLMQLQMCMCLTASARLQ